MTPSNPRDPIEAPATSLPWNESNPEWWEGQIVGVREGEPLYRWLVNEWAAARDEGRKEAVRLREALERIKAWSRWHKEEARTQLRGTMQLVHEEATTALDDVARHGRSSDPTETDDE